MSGTNMQLVYDPYTRRPINRIIPDLHPGTYQTYGLSNPSATHTRIATCDEVSCLAKANGWQSRFDVGNPDGRQKANWIRLFSKKKYSVKQVGDIVTFTFPAGQECPQEHKVKLERDPILYKVGGDWRGYTNEPVVMRPADWVDDFANHQQSIADAHQKG